MKRVLGITEEQLQNGPWSVLTALQDAGQALCAIDEGDGRDTKKKEHGGLSAGTSGIPKNTAVEKQRFVAQSVAEAWRSIILTRKLAFSDVLQILDMERKWLEAQADLRDDPHLLAASHDVGLTIESIKRML